MSTYTQDFTSMKSAFFSTTFFIDQVKLCRLLVCCHCSVNEYQENCREPDRILYPLKLDFCTYTAQQYDLKHISDELLWNETRLLCSVCMVHTTILYDTQTDYEIPHYTAVAWYSQVIFITNNLGSRIKWYLHCLGYGHMFRLLF